MPGGVITHLSVDDADQVAAEDRLPFTDVYTHAFGLDGSAAFIVGNGIVAHHGHAGAGAAGFHPFRNGAGKSRHTLLCHGTEVGGARQFEAGLTAFFRDREPGCSIDDQDYVLHIHFSLALLRNYSFTRLLFISFPCLNIIYSFIIIVGGA